MLKRINLAAPVLLCPLLLVCAWPSQAQQNDTPSDDSPALQSVGCVRAFDEYGDVCFEDEQARLDNFAIELQQNPKEKGYILFYHGVNELPARLTEQRGDRALDYLVNTRGIDAARVSVITGGFREEQTTELWVAPEDAPAPQPSGTVAYTKPTGRVYQFDEQYLDISYVEPQADAEESGEAESEADATPAPDAAQSEPVEEQATNSDAQAEAQAQTEEDAQDSSTPDEFLYWASERYADAVKQEDGAQACIIYYADGEHIDLSEIQNIIERGKDILMEKYGLKADCFVTLYGGYRATPTIETWVVPANNSLPAPTPEQRPIEEPAMDDDAQ
ncbi:MAG TPA: hypothetical protein VGC91_05665 [Pyrinomonadaceae bacterium]